MHGPLAAKRVVDLGLYVAGPYASVPLADLGADVIKIEPLTGDPNRALWRAFACSNRGKRSICVDLKNPDGLAIARKICASADAVQHNYRPGVVERIGLGYAEISKSNPDVVYLETSAYGHTGPMAGQPGFDMMLQAMCGHESRCGGKGNPPAWLIWAPVDFTGGYLGTIATLGALYRRARGGGGGVVRTNLLDAGIYLLSELVQGPDGEFRGLAPMNQRQTGTHPANSLYQTADGWIAVVALSEEQAVSLANALQLEGVAGKARSEWSTAEHDKIDAAMATMSNEEAVTTLRDAGVWVEPCRRDLEQTIFDDPGWQATGLIETHAHPEFNETQLIGNTVRLNGERPSTPRSGMVPTPGQHTRDLLDELGYSEADIEDYFERGVVA